MNEIYQLLEKKYNAVDLSNRRLISESEYKLRRATLEKMKESCLEMMKQPGYQAEIVRGRIVCEGKNLTYRLAAIIYYMNLISRSLDAGISYNTEDDRN